MTEPTPQTIQDVLEEFLRGAAPTFEPYAQYSREADALYVFTQDVPTYRRRVDDRLTVFVSADDDSRFAGCVIKGMRSLVQECLGVEVKFPRDLRAGEVFFAYALAHPNGWEAMAPSMGDLGRVSDRSVCLS